MGWVNQDYKCRAESALKWVSRVSKIGVTVSRTRTGLVLKLGSAALVGNNSCTFISDFTHFHIHTPKSPPFAYSWLCI